MRNCRPVDSIIDLSQCDIARLPSRQVQGTKTKTYRASRKNPSTFRSICVDAAVKWTGDCFFWLTLYIEIFSIHTLLTTIVLEMGQCQIIKIESIWSFATKSTLFGKTRLHVFAVIRYSSVQTLIIFLHLLSMSQVWSTGVTVKLFADDARLYSVFSDSSTPDCLQSCLTTIFDWSDHWQRWRR